MKSNQSDIEEQKTIDEIMPVLANELDYHIARLVGRRTGFALMVFPLNEPGITTYTSNVCRDDMIKVLKEAHDQLANNESMPLGQGSVS